MTTKRVIFTATRNMTHLRTDGRDRLTVCGKRMPPGMRASMINRLETHAPCVAGVCPDCLKIAEEMIRRGIERAAIQKTRSHGIVEPFKAVDADDTDTVWV